MTILRGGVIVSRGGGYLGVVTTFRRGMVTIFSRGVGVVTIFRKGMMTISRRGVVTIFSGVTIFRGGGGGVVTNFRKRGW